ncbi:hypothetical protein LH427_00205 [Laribacter hongkongensis]|uniref:protein YgfX n=1 Tax=Laribacter hongkongensis TaxID=168471 RepID=UPI001877DC3A|nr:protein YgfX [Laribacter hongkongensis]MBE5529902.1 hypothetical protein [Laribacter hongkongensis]MCG8992344.1 hypothetical protein [Laribacter hongkongensis]MCG8997479.1 hypothetical protein [Laribacter hongkongensis]MCG9000126.1 hypothetical protein [Laribacter hongkongensis]MCG9003626.1 hypothetical protein [Laribacter hongkongensis]
MKPPAVEPFACVLRPSRTGGGLAMLLAVLAGISVCLAGMAWLVPAVLLLALWRLRQEGWLGAPRQRLVLDVQGQLWLDGLPVWRSPATRVWPWLVWLAGRTATRPVRLLLWPDRLDAGAGRCLRRYLIWYRSDPSVDPAAHRSA